MKERKTMMPDGAECTKCHKIKWPSKVYLNQLKWQNLPYVCAMCRKVQDQDEAKQ